MDSNSPLMPQFANLPEIPMPTMPEMPSVQQEFVGGLQGLNKQIMDQMAAQREAEKKKALEAFEFHRKYTGNKELAWQSFMNSGKLPANYQPTKEDRKLFEQEMDADQQRTRMSLYGDQLTEAQKRGDAESIIALTEKIYGQPLDESRKEYIRATSQASQLQDMSSTIENLKNSPPSVSYPVISNLLKLRGMPVPSYEEFLRTYYPPRATGTQSNVTAQNMRQMIDLQTKQIKDNTAEIAAIDGQMKYAPKDGGAATANYKKAITDRQKFLLQLQGAFLSGNDAGLVNAALTNYNDFITNTYLPAQGAFYQSRGIGLEARGKQATIQLNQAQTELARTKRQEIVALLKVRENDIVARTKLTLQRIFESQQMLGPRKALAESQSELNRYLQTNSQRMWQSALGMLARQERADIEAGKTQEEIDAVRQRRIDDNLSTIMGMDTRLRDMGVDIKYMSTPQSQGLARELINRLNEGESAESLIPGVPGLVAPPVTGKTGPAPAARPAARPSPGPAQVPTTRPGQTLPNSQIGAGRVPPPVPPVPSTEVAAELRRKLAAGPGVVREKPKPKSPAKPTFAAKKVRSPETLLGKNPKDSNRLQ